MLDLSGGFQNATSHLLRKRQEVYDAQNAQFNLKIGSAVRRPGYEPVGNVIEYGQDSLFGDVYTYYNNNNILVGVNDSSATNATLRYLNQGGEWTTILSDAVPNTRFQGVNYLNDYYICGEIAGTYYPLTCIDSTLTPTTSKNVVNAPACKFIAQYAGKLYAINCRVNGVTYKDRLYVSSGATGVVTQVQDAVSGWATQIHVNSVKYLKVGMQIDIYGAQTSNLKISALTIVSVDKLNNMIGFVGQNIDVAINDEIWISGRYNQLTTLWNTDYPTPQSADWIRIPPGINENPEFTGWTVNNNRLFLFAKNSMFKWDGTNLITISPSVGCVSHETIQNIGPWTLWLHESGIWGFNDNTGQLKLVSRAITPLIERINPSMYPYTSAVVNDRQVYKLSVGELMSDTVATTSTSTSSTSTSSTSSSTSSTSTSSTSTSTVTNTTTSTSSSSTSSTSSSTSSTSTSSTSTSTSSTSTSTALTGKKCVRINYDFNLNIWWYDVLNRQQRYQFLHWMNGFHKPYFTDENGYLFRDETGTTDFGNAIPMYVDSGRLNCGTEQAKTFDAIQVDSENARGGIIQFSIDGGDWMTLGQLNNDIETLNIPQRNQLSRGRDIRFAFRHNDRGEAPVLNGMTVYFTLSESIVNELGESK